jgi:SH3-like domain-containing protein
MSPQFNKYGEIIPDDPTGAQVRVDSANPSVRFNQYGEIERIDVDSSLNQKPDYDVLNNVINNRTIDTPDFAPLPIREDNHRTVRSDHDGTPPTLFIILGVIAVIIFLIILISIFSSNMGAQGDVFTASSASVEGELIIQEQILEQIPEQLNGPELLPTAYNPNEEIALIQVVGQDVNIRERPGSEERKLQVVHRGKILTLLNDIRVVENNEWRYVRYDGYYGWVNMRYIRIIELQDIPEVRARVVGVLPDTLRVREDPSTEAKIIDRISEHSEVEVLGCTNQGGRAWCSIQIDNTRGWVVQDYLAFL